MSATLAFLIWVMHRLKQLKIMHSGNKHFFSDEGLKQAPQGEHRRSFGTATREVRQYKGQLKAAVIDDR